MISGDYASSSDEEDGEVEVQHHSPAADDRAGSAIQLVSFDPATDEAAPLDETELLEYELIVDGEVVGTTHMTPAAARVAMPGSLPIHNQAADVAASASSTTPRSSLPSVCAACSAAAPRYRCPGCSAMSCSLQCVGAHKEQSGCTGKRPRSSYVPLHSFTANQLQHDLFFLEEVARNAHSAQRHPLIPHSLTKRSAHSREGEDEEGQEGLGAFTARDVSGRYLALQRACVRLGVKLLVMPSGMRRHSLNTSAWNARDGRLSWHVEWLLDGDKLSVHQSSVDGETTWRDALVALLSQRDKAAQRRQRREGRKDSRQPRNNQPHAQHIHEERKEAEEVNAQATEAPTVAGGEQAQRVVAHHSDPKLRSQLQRYADALDRLTLHLKVPMTTSAEACYYPLKLSAPINASLKGSVTQQHTTTQPSSALLAPIGTIADNATGTVSVVSLTVIEFPSVHVVFDTDAFKYPPYQPPPPSLRHRQTPTSAIEQATSVQHAHAEDVQPASAVPPASFAVPHMHPDRLIRSARLDEAERKEEVVRRWH